MAARRNKKNEITYKLVKPSYESQLRDKSNNDGVNKENSGNELVLQSILDNHLERRKKTKKKGHAVCEASSESNYNEPPVIDHFRAKMQLVDHIPDEYAEHACNSNKDSISGDSGIWKDEKEENFDQDWIRSMMGENNVTKPIVNPDGHQIKEYRDIEWEFDNIMREFQNDMDIGEGDARTQGSLPISTYAKSLEEFTLQYHNPTCPLVSHTDSDTVHKSGRYKKFITALGEWSRNHNIYDCNEDGYFYTILPSKNERRVLNFSQERKELTRATLKQLCDLEKINETLEAKAYEEQSDEIITYKVKDQKYDCETILSTYSTRLNRPSVLVPPKEKAVTMNVESKNIKDVPIKDASKQNFSINELFSMIKQENYKPPNEEHDTDTMEPSLISINNNKLLTKEERIARRKELKKQKQQRKEEKKNIKSVYKKIEKEVCSSRNNTKKQKEITNLSLVTPV